MRLRGVVVALVLLVSTAAVARADRQVEVEIGSRSYRIDLPERAKGAPVVLVLHGGGGNPAQIARNSGFSGPALAQGYAVIYPAGTSRRGGAGLLTWNAGSCCGSAAAQRIDDVAFLDQVIADAVRRYGLDGDRVFLTGMSNGSMMAELYAARRPDRVRAVAGVSGTLDLRRARPRGAVAALIVHGTDDTHVPYEGGKGSEGLTDTVFEPVADVVAAFVQAQGSNLSVRTQTVDPAKDSTSVTQSDYVDSAGTVRVRLLTVIGGGHVWPGARRAGRQGGDTRDIRANDEILKFFAQFR